MRKEEQKKLTQELVKIVRFIKIRKNGLINQAKKGMILFFLLAGNNNIILF